MLSPHVRAGWLAGALLALSPVVTAAQDDTTGASPQGAGSGVLEQLEKDAQKVADKAAEIGEGAGRTAESTADTAAEEAESLYERTMEKGRRAYEWSKRKLEETF